MTDLEYTTRLHAYVEQFAILMEGIGQPRGMGRIIGWLLVCDPPAQSLTEIADAVHASKGGVSTYTRQLLAMGLLEKVPRRGERGTWYRLRPNAWLRMVENEMVIARLIREHAATGMHLVAENNPDAHIRLSELHDLFKFFEGEFPAMIARWHAGAEERAAAHAAAHVAAGTAPCKES